FFPPPPPPPHSTLFPYTTLFRSQVNCGWVIAANIAADLAAWTRLLGCRDDEDLRDANPDTLRYRIWHIPARPARHAWQRLLKIADRKSTRLNSSHDQISYAVFCL